MKQYSTILQFQRTAKYITYARASTDDKIIEDFFTNLEKEITGIEPKNIWNYDKTNLVDDPGCKKVITKQGAKYPEQIRNSSKACTSLMFCGNGAGELAFYMLITNLKSCGQQGWRMGQMEQDTSDQNPVGLATKFLRINLYP